MTRRTRDRTSAVRARHQPARKPTPIIDDPRRPHLLRLGVPYRVVALDGDLVVRSVTQIEAFAKKGRRGSVQPQSAEAAV